MSALWRPRVHFFSFLFFFFLGCNSQIAANMWATWKTETMTLCNTLRIRALISPHDHTAAWLCMTLSRWGKSLGKDTLLNCLPLWVIVPGRGTEEREWREVKWVSECQFPHIYCMCACSSLQPTGAIAHTGVPMLEKHHLGCHYGWLHMITSLFRCPSRE